MQVNIECCIHKAEYSEAIKSMKFWPLLQRLDLEGIKIISANHVLSHFSHMSDCWHLVTAVTRPLSIDTPGKELGAGAMPQACGSSQPRGCIQVSVSPALGDLPTDPPGSAHQLYFDKTHISKI